MNVFDVILIGLALSMDACAITIANCATYKNSLDKTKEWSMPVCFAVFQGIMPLIGYFAGSLVAEYLESYSGYLTAGVFFALSLKIVIDAIKEKNRKKSAEPSGEEEVRPSSSDFSFGVLLLQGVATSIDALIVGVTLGIGLTFSVWIAILIISGVTFLLTAISLLFGKYLGKLLGNYATIAGAVILFVIAVENLIKTII